jgi:hypothetical protein
MPGRAAIASHGCLSTCKTRRSTAAPYGSLRTIGTLPSLCRAGADRRRRLLPTATGEEILSDLYVLHGSYCVAHSLGRLDAYDWALTKLPGILADEDLGSVDKKRIGVRIGHPTDASDGFPGRWPVCWWMVCRRGCGSPQGRTDSRQGSLRHIPGSWRGSSLYIADNFRRAFLISPRQTTTSTGRTTRSWALSRPRQARSLVRVLAGSPGLSKQVATVRTKPVIAGIDLPDFTKSREAYKAEGEDALWFYDQNTYCLHIIQHIGYAKSLTGDEDLKNKLGASQSADERRKILDATKFRKCKDQVEKSARLTQSSSLPPAQLHQDLAADGHYTRRSRHGRALRGFGVLG